MDEGDTPWLRGNGSPWANKAEACGGLVPFLVVYVEHESGNLAI